MTLILTVANSRGVYQSSDYQLTDPNTGALVSDRAGSKQLRANFKELNLFLAFTGVAGTTKHRTIDWLTAELKSLSLESNLQAICDALSRKSQVSMRPYGRKGRLTMVLSVASVGKPFRLAEISNADWGNKSRHQFDIHLYTIKKPFALISGYSGCVPVREQALLKALARKLDATPKEAMDALAEINATAARNNRGCVSEGCWVTAQYADGRDRHFATFNVGDQDGSITELALGMNLTDIVKKNFRAAPGKELRPVQSAGLMLAPRPGAPMLEPIGGPKTFLVSSPSIVGRLTSPSGQHCASIEIGPISKNITMRRNERVAVPFAPIRLTSIQSDNENFAKPMHPWPMLSSPLSIDGATVPSGWEYRVGYWIEDDVHHVEIPQSSLRIRKVAFLGDDDELVITVPECLVTWDSIQDVPTGVLEAAVIWCARLDGTNG